MEEESFCSEGAAQLLAVGHCRKQARSNAAGQAAVDLIVRRGERGEALSDIIDSEFANSGILQFLLSKKKDVYVAFGAHQPPVAAVFFGV